MRIITLILAIVGAYITTHVRVKDGGVTDMLILPIAVAWYLFTAVCIALPKAGKMHAFISKAWWLQIIAPVAIVITSSLVVESIRSPE